MTEETHNYGGLKLKTDNDSPKDNENRENFVTTSSVPKFEYNAFDGENLHLENNIYFQDDSVSYSSPTEKKKLTNGPANWTFILYVALVMVILFFQIGTMQKVNKAKKLIAKGHTVTAEVTKTVRHYRRRGSDYYSMYGEYNVDGVNYRGAYLGKSYHYVYDGERVMVYYDIKNPRNITTDEIAIDNKVTFSVAWILVVMFGVLAYRAYVDPEGAAAGLRNAFTSKYRRWR